MLEQIPLFAMMKAKLGYDSQRQRVIAENVANSDTPGFAPRDLNAFNFESAMSRQGGALSPARTNAMHLSAKKGSAGPFKTVSKPDSEARLDGNQVVLEEQMMKLNDSNADYSAVIGLYTQSLDMLQTAVKEPGK